MQLGTTIKVRVDHSTSDDDDDDDDSLSDTFAWYRGCVTAVDAGRVTVSWLPWRDQTEHLASEYMKVAWREHFISPTCDCFTPIPTP